jgi:hypothetical protein
MNDKLIKSTHNGVLKIGAVELECHVLENGQRVFSPIDMLKAFNLDSLQLTQKSHPRIFKQFLDRIKFYSFCNQELATRILCPVRFTVPGRGGPVRKGYDVEILPEICSAILHQTNPKSRDLPIDLYPAVEPARKLLSAFAKVGIVALVDEATGYQEIRDRDALRKILDRYLAAEYSAWAKRFPDDFYKEMFRLRNWQWRGMNVNRPGVVGKYTNDIVYHRLAPGLLEELRKINPPDDQGRRKVRFHQWLTSDIGHPALNQHIFGVMTLMKISASWEGFYHHLAKAFPKIGEQAYLPFEEFEFDDI